jgi:hypothetical protein
MREISSGSNPRRIVKLDQNDGTVVDTRDTNPEHKVSSWRVDES